MLTLKGTHYFGKNFSSIDQSPLETLLQWLYLTLHSLKFHQTNKDKILMR